MLFCLSGNYTPKALDAMAKNPNTNRREAFEKLVKAAGGKLEAIYFTISEGPGAIAIFDVDPPNASAIAAVVASSEGVCDVKLQRLFTQDEVIAVRQKRIQLQAAYRAPDQ
jgi:uncharacterized protein with GYD domain